MSSYLICQNSTAIPPKWENLGRRPTNICPYRGLFPFREEDARFFFGRFDFTAKLVEAVANQPLVAIVGPSGIGKSSVVFAGLIPQLRREGNWQVVRLRPGDRPFTALAIAIASVQEPNLHITAQRQKVQELATYLRDKNGALRDAVEGILWDIPNCDLLLVVDQFEELYTVCQDEEERLCFLDRLLEVVGAIANFKLVLTLRADFLGQALSYRPFADALQHQDLKLGPMKRPELEEAIARPAEKLGVTIEDGLTKRILDGVEKQPGNLPLLEFALTELWSNMNNATLTHGAYDRIGGVEKALANHAEAVFVKYPEEQERMRRIFIQLVHPGEGTQDTRRVASRAEVGEDNWDLAVRLASERLVVSSGKEATGSETVEIVHEALIWGWERLQEWIHANRRFRTWQERLRVSLRQWEENHRVDGALLQRVPLAEAEGWLQERGGELSGGEREFIWLSLELRDREQAEKERHRRQIILGLSSGLAVALSLAGLAGLGWWQAEFQKKRAEEFRVQLETAKAVIEGRKIPDISLGRQTLLQLPRKNLVPDKNAVPNLAKIPPLKQSEAIDIITKWLQAKQRLFAPPYDRQISQQFNTDRRQQEIIESADWLQQNNAYYQYQLQRVEALEAPISNANYATIKVITTEQMQLYINGIADSTNSEIRNRKTLYTFKWENNRWKIADLQVLN